MGEGTPRRPRADGHKREGRRGVGRRVGVAVRVVGHLAVANEATNNDIGVRAPVGGGVYGSRGNDRRVVHSAEVGILDNGHHGSGLRRNGLGNRDALLLLLLVHVHSGVVDAPVLRQKKRLSADGEVLVAIALDQLVLLRGQRLRRPPQQPVSAGIPYGSSRFRQCIRNELRDGRKLQGIVRYLLSRILHLRPWRTVHILLVRFAETIACRQFGSGNGCGLRSTAVSNYNRPEQGGGGQESDHMRFLLRHYLPSVALSAVRWRRSRVRTVCTLVR